MTISHTYQSNEIHFYDPSNGRRLSIETDGIGECEAATPPPGSQADAAIELCCRRLRVTACPLGHVRDASGTILAMIPGASDGYELCPTADRIELHSSIKIELHGLGTGQISTADDRFTVTFDREQPVVITARSIRPTSPGSVTVPPTPTAVIRALSTFGAGLLTTTVERSYPTMRRPPPRLEVDRSIQVPDTLSPLATGIDLVVPATWEAAVSVAPLAYYLGARCRTGSVPRLETRAGFTFPLENDVVPTAARVLKQVFLLDVVVRTEGRYPVPLAERAAIEPLLGLDLETLYCQSIDKRLESYLAISFSELADHLPSWPLVADVPPSPAAVTLLSPLAGRLAVVRPIGNYERLDSATARDFLLRSRYDQHTRGEHQEDLFVRPPPAAGEEHVWFGAGIPIGASLGIPAAFERPPNPPADEQSIDVVVVHNGQPSQVEHDAVTRAYNTRMDLPFSVSVDRDVSVAELTTHFRTPADIVHYIGHVDDAGFRCTDGHFDARNLEDVAVRSFLLNACHSVEQGRALIERGAAGGVVTFGQIPDREASTIGVTMARLLQRGFPLAPAIAIARTTSLAGLQYLVVGDGSTDVAQPADGPPVLCDAKAMAAGDTFEVTIHAWLPGSIGMGIVAVPYLGEETYAVPPGRLTTITVSSATLCDFLDRYGGPVRVDDTLCWCSEDVSDLFAG